MKHCTRIYRLATPPVVVLFLTLTVASVARAEEPHGFGAEDSWAGAMIAARQEIARLEGDPAKLAVEAWQNIADAFPEESAAALQDAPGTDPGAWLTTSTCRPIEAAMLEGLFRGFDAAPERLRQEYEQFHSRDGDWPAGEAMRLYERAARARRAQRLATVLEQSPRIVFTKHYDMGGSHYAYTEGQSDAQSERHFVPGTALCVLELSERDGAVHSEVRTLIEDPHGVIRDPDVSWDGRRILFAWKKSDRQDDYHLHEYDLETGAVRQITFGLGFADYEGAYLPDGDIVFNSTRCVQIVDCWWTEVSNLYRVAPDGAFMRRLGFDQVHTNYPTVLDDGRVIYTRWDYNDRGQIYPQPLFQMKPDGTGQTEFYGNNSWFPTTILHARGIPGTNRIVSIFTGHHSRQKGKLGIVDPDLGHQENQGAQLIAPVRDTPADRIDSYGQQGDQFQYPYPVSEEDFLVTYWPGPAPGGWPKRFALYAIDADGRYELLAYDSANSCNQPVPLRGRAQPHLPPSFVDYTRNDGVYYVQNVYEGPGLEGVEPGTIDRIRVVAIDYRAAGVRSNRNGGPAGGALISTPVSIGNGTWDPKIVIGDAPVEEDGSACFRVPARTPVYFQALDAKGRAVQTMRTWTTLQPGETFSCVGCHEPKRSTSNVTKATTVAMQKGPRDLQGFQGPPRGFSFVREVQPILDRHCTGCHWDREPVRQLMGLSRKEAPDPERRGERKAFSLLGERVEEKPSGRFWTDSYLMLTGAVQDGGFLRGRFDRDLVNWAGTQSTPPMLPPDFAGSRRSRLMTMLEKGHGGVEPTPEEYEKIACWIDLFVPYCGDYVEENAWTDAERAFYDRYLDKRRRMERVEHGNIQALLRAQSGTSVDAAALAPETELGWNAAEISLQVIDGGGLSIASDRAREAFWHRPAGVVFRRDFRGGDTVRLDGPRFLTVQLDASLPPVTVFAPDGQVECSFPAGPAKRCAFDASHFGDGWQTVLAWQPAKDCLLEYRNLALNPYDFRTDTPTYYPHASTNSVCRDEPVFEARNAIDGCGANDGHGDWPYQSWGPDKRTDLWWRVDFGRPVRVDKVVLTIRADFPHDAYWRSGVLEFSDGSREAIAIEPDDKARPITFEFPERATEWVRLTDLVQPEPLGWCALMEVEVWGRDVESSLAPDPVERVVSR